MGIENRKCKSLEDRYVEHHPKDECNIPLRTEECPAVERYGDDETNEENAIGLVHLLFRDTTHSSSLVSLYLREPQARTSSCFAGVMVDDQVTTRGLS